jgi:hypothetical protein
MMVSRFACKRLCLNRGLSFTAPLSPLVFLLAGTDFAFAAGLPLLEGGWLPAVQHVSRSQHFSSLLANQAFRHAFQKKHSL